VKKINDGNWMNCGLSGRAELSFWQENRKSQQNLKSASFILQSYRENKTRICRIADN
jgi:hypothetical protein